MTNGQKKHRLIQTAAAALSCAPNGELNTVVLNKVLFYSDLTALRDTGDVLTKNSYIALEHGPVISKYDKRLIKALADSGIALQEDRWNGAKPVVLAGDFTPDGFLSHRLDSIREVTEHFAKKTSADASDFSHENPGWQIAWERSKETGKPTAINMMIALQQIWMTILGSAHLSLKRKNGK